MIKGAFVSKKLNKGKVDKIAELGFSAVFTDHKNLKPGLREKLQKKNLGIFVEIGLFAGEEFWQRYPDSRPVDRGSKQTEKIHWYAGVCPNHPQIRKEKLQLINSIIQKYSPDGIWLDFIRYPCHWEVLAPDLTEYCFCENCLKKFKGETHKGWVAWKCNQITNFAADVRSLIDKTDRKVKLGMFSVPWRKEDFDGAIKRVIGQDFKKLAGYVDVFSPMVYHKLCGRKPEWIREVVVFMDRLTGKPIWPIIQTMNEPEKIPGREFEKVVQLAAQKPSQGMIVFYFEDLLKDKSKIETLKEVLN